MAETTSIAPQPASGDIAESRRQAERFIAQSKSANTLRAYRSDWRHFETWCSQHGIASLPADVEAVASYLSDLATTSRVSTFGNCRPIARIDANALHCG